MNERLLGADALGHVVERVVERPAQAGLRQHPLELLARRLDTLVDDRLQGLLEAVAGLERGGDADQEVGQLVLERGQPAVRLDIHTNASGISAPMTSEARESRPDEPAAVASRPSRMEQPALM